MKTKNEMSKQRAYSPPQVERIKLDNEISLVLASDPPIVPGESLHVQNAPEYFNNDPFKA
jgi:secreted Zn-dependent insulinase-like peptidase